MNTVQVKNTVIGEGRPKICVPIVGKTKTDILEEAKKITTLPVDVVEWRVDWFDDVFVTEKVLETAKELQEVLKDIPVLLTFRTSKEGGEPPVRLRRLRIWNTLPLLDFAVRLCPALPLLHRWN